LYINATVFTLLHSYMFQPSSGHPQGVLIHFMSRSTAYVSRCKYQMKEQHVVSYVASVTLIQVHVKLMTLTVMY